ncbi:MAG TPA: hypothetical protein VF551_00920 [Chthoniobacterales bacterium]|jgi:hypothetical protein
MISASNLQLLVEQSRSLVVEAVRLPIATQRAREALAAYRTQQHAVGSAHLPPAAAATA